MPNDDDDGQDHMFRFIPLKEVDSSATFGEVAKCCTIWPTGSRLTLDRSVDVDVFIWKPNRLGVPSYRESHVSGKGVPKSREINIGMPQRRRQRVPQK